MFEMLPSAYVTLEILLLTFSIRIRFRKERKNESRFFAINFTFPMLNMLIYIITFQHLLLYQALKRSF